MGSKKIEASYKRHILEVHYPTIPRVFDSIGRIITDIHDDIRKDFAHWVVQIGGVNFKDELNGTKRHFIISHNSSVLSFENPGSTTEFKDKVKKYLKFMHNELGDSINEHVEMKYRLLQMHLIKRLSSKDTISKLITEKLVNFPAGNALVPLYSMLRLEHEHGRISIAPVERDESWVKNTFVDLSTRFNVGLLMDIESNINEATANDYNNVTSMAEKVYEATEAVEEFLLQQLELLDDKR